MDSGAETASASATHLIDKLEVAVRLDPSNRGVAGLARGVRTFSSQSRHEPVGDLEQAARSLHGASTVGIVTGFPCIVPPPHHETDGPPGALALARALELAGKRVVLLADSTTYPVLAHAASVADVGPGTTIVHYPQRHSDESESHDEISADPSSSGSSSSSSSSGGGGGGGGVHGAPGGDAQTSDPDAETEAERALAQYVFDHLVAIERAGRAFDGKFYTMRGRDISAYVEGSDDLFLAALRRHIDTTGIGDGGNELGMGAVNEAVRRCIPQGDLIGCATSTNHLIAAGVSNWGGYALAAAVAILHYEATSNRDKAISMLHTKEREAAVVSALNDIGVVCGISGGRGMVDGLKIEKDHFDMIDTIAGIVSEVFS